MRFYERGGQICHTADDQVIARADPRDYYDRRKGILRTFTEAAQVVGSAAWSGKEERGNKVYALWGINDSVRGNGYVEWVLQNGTCGIANYSEDVRLTKFPKNSLAYFVDERILLPETAGFVAMDSQALSALQVRDDMDPEKLRFFFGVKKAL